MMPSTLVDGGDLNVCTYVVRWHVYAVCRRSDGNEILCLQEAAEFVPDKGPDSFALSNTKKLLVVIVGLVFAELLGFGDQISDGKLLFHQAFRL